ncbi:MAG: glycosyltransferase family 87 protein [Bacteroidota bacterium]
MKSTRSFFILVIFVILSRIPFLSGGFGADGDGWRVAKSALMLWNEHLYQVSRFPGFPVYEFLQAPIIALSGSFASNAASLLVFIVSLLLLRSILQRWNIPHGDIVMIIYSFLPILWKNSALSMDYVWGLCGIVASLYLLLEKRFMLAGVVLGLAAGTRISHIAYVLPMYFLFPGTERRQWKSFAITACAVTAVCYLPVLLSNNYLLVVQDYLADQRHYSFVKKVGFYFYRFTYSLGLLGWIGIVAAVVLNRKKVQSAFTHVSFRTSSAAIGTAALVFALLPDEREYLIPMFPFLLIAVAGLVQRSHYIAIMILLFSYAFVSVDVVKHSVANPELELNIQRGYLIKEFTDRQMINEKRIRLAQTPIPDSSFVMIGMGPMFWLENPDVEVARGIEKEFRHDCAKSLRGNEVYFIYALYKPQLDEIRKRGYTVYYWDEMKEYLETFLDYKLEDEQIKVLKVEYAR